MAPVRELRIVTRTRERYQAITALHADGDRSRRSRARWAWTGTPCAGSCAPPALEELQAKTLQRASLLDGYTDYLHQRWAQGCTDAAALAREITALGYRGSDQTVRRYLHPLRTGDRPAARGPRHRPSARSPDGSCDVQTVSNPTSRCASSRSWRTAR